MEVFHKSVMITEVIAALRCRAGAVYVDGTVGGGGHAEAILQNTGPDGLLIGIDADGEALRASWPVAGPHEGGLLTCCQSDS